MAVRLFPSAPLTMMGLLYTYSRFMRIIFHWCTQNQVNQMIMCSELWCGYAAYVFGPVAAVGVGELVDHLQDVAMGVMSTV